MSTQCRILVRAPSWLGDFCMAEPVFSAIDAACERWTLAGPRRLLELVDRRFPNAKRIVTDLPNSGEGSEGGVQAWREHDAALFLNGSFRSVWTAFRAGIPERVSWATSCRGLLATTAPKPAREAGGIAFGTGRRGRFPRRLPRPFGAASIELAGLLGVSVIARAPTLCATERDREAADARLRAAGLDPEQAFALVNVGGPPGSSKSPTLPLWREWLANPAEWAFPSQAASLPLVLVAGPGEEARALALAEFGVALVDPPVSLGELLALAERATCGLTSDSGPRHLASAAGLAQTVLFGSTDPRHTAEHMTRTRSVRGLAACAPCHLAVCPLEGADELRCHESARRSLAPLETARRTRRDA